MRVGSAVKHEAVRENESEGAISVQERAEKKKIKAYSVIGGNE